MRVIPAILCLVAATLLLGACGRPTTRLVVYTAAEADELPAYAADFRRAHPDIDLVWVRDSTGVVASKLLAEAKDPRADVVFALAVSSFGELDRAGLIAPYAPAGAARLKPRFADPRRPPHYVGTALFTSVICANTRLLAQKGLPLPGDWSDLLKPAYRGLIEMPDPGSSGTGLLTVSGWLQGMGEAQGWRYMDQLNDNILAYAHSGSKPCRDVARGEAAIGVGLDTRAAAAKRQGLPVAVIVPRGGVGWDFEASGLVRGARHPAAARAFLDWATSDPAMRLYARNFSEVSAPGAFGAPQGLPADLTAHLAPMSVAWTSENRDRIIAEWSRRFSVKSGSRS